MVAKDVLEYVVFEKHLSNVYGIWRLHSKIIPDWAPPREPGMLTFRVQPEPPNKEVETEQAEDKEDLAPVEDSEEKESIYDRFGKFIGRK